MASAALQGFIKGFANTTLDSIQRREAYDMELRKAKMLEELRTEQAKELADYQELLNRKKVDKNLTSADYTSGKRTLRNEYGETIGTTDIDPYEMETAKMSREKDRLDLENTRSTIESRARDDARQDRSTNAYVASLNRKGLDGGSGGADKPTDLDRANELLYRYQREAAETVKSGNISQSALRQAAIAIIRNTRTGDEAQEKFLTFLDNYRTGRKVTDQRKRLDALAQDKN